MDLEAFVRKFEYVVVDVPIGSLEAGTRFREVPGWDSMTVLKTIVLADSEFGVELGIERLNGCHTLEDIYRVVTKKAPLP
jgi:acyl carrier protein